MSLPLVYVVILNYNGEIWIEPCLKTLSATSYDNIKILVVDNASTDNSVQLVRNRFPQIELIINNLNLGFSEGNNVGIRRGLMVNADYIVLLNPDTKVKPEWLTEIIDVGESNSNIGILGPVQLFYENDEFNAWTTTVLRDQTSLLESRVKERQWIPVEWVEGSCIVIKKSVFKDIGLFDPIYFAFYEEIDFCRRAKSHGYQIAIVPGSRIHHHRGGIWLSSRGIKRRRNFLSDRSQFIYHLTDPHRCLSHNLWWYLVTLVTKIKEIVSEIQPLRAWDLLKIQFSILFCLPTILDKWRKDREALWLK